MKGASLVVYVNADGEVIGARNVDSSTGTIGDDKIKYGDAENAANKKFAGGKYKNKIRYPNSCCWKLTNGVWVCAPC